MSWSSVLYCTAKIYQRHNQFSKLKISFIAVMLTGSWTQVKSLTCKAWLVLIRFEKGLIDQIGLDTLVT